MDKPIILRLKLESTAMYKIDIKEISLTGSKNLNDIESTLIVRRLKKRV